MALSSCVSPRVDLVKTGAADVRIGDSPGSFFKNVDIYYDRDANETIIQGVLTVTGLPLFPGNGKHVHVTVVSPVETVIVEEIPRVDWRRYSRSRNTTGRFTVRLAELLPNGTLVDVAYHDARHRKTSEG